jgi:hypothetical protein
MFRYWRNVMPGRCRASTYFSMQQEDMGGRHEAGRRHIAISHRQRSLGPSRLVLTLMPWQEDAAAK